jgi:hypothetical protein
MNWLALVNLSATDLASLDTAQVNLACAAGLPGTDHLDAAATTRVLNAWAEHVQRETRRCAGQFQREPAVFENSWAYFRILVLATVLQQDCGVHYDSELIPRDDFFGDAANLFLHGILASKGGTCSSLPPLYVAVGRRLGYPLRLVQTSSHLFARWDDVETGERFNVECTSPGLNCHADDHYRVWPNATEPAEVERNGWLVSLTPREELALFLATRGHCWLAHRRFRDATEAYAWAHAMAPRQAGHGHCLMATLGQWSAQLRRQLPPGLSLPMVRLGQRRLPPLPQPLEAAIRHLEALEAVLPSIQDVQSLN